VILSNLLLKNYSTRCNEFFKICLQSEIIQKFKDFIDTIQCLYILIFYINRLRKYIMNERREKSQFSSFIFKKQFIKIIDSFRLDFMAKII